MRLPIYLDYAATTPVDPRIVATMLNCLTLEGEFANSASTHRLGQGAMQIIQTARQQVANIIHCQPNEVFWTSGATESVNLAIKGAAHFYKKKGKHLVTSQIEHKAVLDSCRQLEREGFSVTYVKPDATGFIDPEEIAAAIQPDTLLVSIMHVNNEIGTIQDVASIAKITRKNGVLFHVDAAQSIGKIMLDLRELPIDLLSFSAHKIYGPKGVGVLYVRRDPRVHLEAQLHGGQHQNGMRAGTLPTHQIAAMGEACVIAQQEMLADNERIRQMRDQLWEGLQDINEIYLNGDLTKSVPHILNVSFNYVDGESLSMGLPDLAISSGAACNAANNGPSYVLQAIGCHPNLADSALRFSLGRYTTAEDIDFTVAKLKAEVSRLRDMSPRWEAANELQ